MVCKNVTHIHTKEFLVEVWLTEAIKMISKEHGMRTGQLETVSMRNTS